MTRHSRFIALALATAAAVLVALPGPAHAGTTFYVAPGGSDADPGTSAQPWETLQHAADEVGPGDVVVVRDGVYAGFRLSTSGSPGSPVIFKSANPKGAVVDRPGPKNVHDSNIELENWDGSGTVAYVFIKNFEVKNAPNWGIDTRGNSSNHSHHITIADNHVHHNGVNSVKTGIFFAFTDDVTVVRNNSHHNGEHGVYLSNSGDGFDVRRNRLHHNARCGLHMNGDLSQGGDGIISNGTIDKNLIDENGAEGCAGINMDGVTDAIITNNVIVENHASGITMFQQDGGICTRRIQILNNTVVQAADGRWNLVIDDGCRDITLRNNVLLTRHPWRGVLEATTANIPGLDSDYNLVTGRFSVDDGNSVVTLNQWRNLTGGDQHSATTNPTQLFQKDTYRHKPGGIAEDAGDQVAVDQGHDHVARPRGQGHDIGAFETPYCGQRRATIVGSRLKDTIFGTAGDDVIHLLAGVDWVNAGQGNDLVCGGGGNDTIFGALGNDNLRGEAGADNIQGNLGDDVAFGGAGNDSCLAEIEFSCES